MQRGFRTTLAKNYTGSTGLQADFPEKRDENPFIREDRQVTMADVWTDVDGIDHSAKERLGYSTQKPLALLEQPSRLAAMRAI